MQAGSPPYGMLFPGAQCPVGVFSINMVPSPVINDKSITACKANKDWIEACWRNGVESHFPCGTLYLRDYVESPITVGCGRYETSGCGGYWIPADHPTLAGKTSRICQLTPNKEIFRLRGTGLIGNGPLYLEGTGTFPLITVEGRSVGVATGHHRFHQLIAYNAPLVFDALPGYWSDKRDFVRDENHADNCIVNDLIAFNVDSIFRSRNEQSLNWKFRDIFWQGTKSGYGVPFDVERGGSLVVEGFVIENPRWSMLRVKEFSPNNASYVFRDVWVDTMLDPDTNFCWLEYAGDPVAASWSEFSFALDAWVGTQKKPIEQHQQFRVPASLPRNDWQVKIHHVLQGR